MWLAVVVISLALFFAFSNGFHDAANVVSTIIMTRAISPRKALLMAAACEFVAPFFLGSAVAKMIGENIINLPAYDPKALNISVAFLIAALVGAILWNLITWFFGFPSSSSHALIGGMVGAVLVAYGPDKILWGGLLYVVASLVVSPLLGFIFGMLFLKVTLRIFRNATPRVNTFFNRMQIPSSVALALSHGSNDVQKSIGLIALSFVILGFSTGFHVPLWVIASCGAATGSWNSDRRMANHQDHGFKNLPFEVCSCLLCPNFLSDRHFRSGVGGRSGIHDARRFLQHHGCWGGSEDLSRAVGISEKYHPGLVYHHPGLSVDGGIKFPYSSKDSLLRPERIGGKVVKDV